MAWDDRSRRSRAGGCGPCSTPLRASRRSGVYLVGGTVRDILLGEPGFDVDLAVEGDGQAFAQALAAELAGSVQPHDAFGTAVVDYGEANTSTWSPLAASATTRRRALPTVEPSTIQDDLFRRDFAINAMASRLTGEAAGGSSTRSRAGATSRRRRSACSTTARSSTTRRGLPGASLREPLRLRAGRAHRRARPRGDRVRPRGPLSPADCATSSCCCSTSLGRSKLLRPLAELGADRAIHPPRGRRARVTLFDAPAGATRPLRPRDSVVAPRPGRPRARCRRAARLARRAEARRQDARAIEAARDRRRRSSPSSCASGAIRPRSSRSPSRTRPTRRFSRSRSRTRRRCATTSSALARRRLEVDGTDLAELGLAESPRVGEVLAELRRRKLNGELDGRDSELRGGAGADRRSDRWEHAPGPYEVVVLDARRRRQRGPLRLAQPRPRDRGRARAGGREPPAPLRRGRRRPRCAVDELPAPLDRRPARRGRARAASAATGSGRTSAGCRCSRSRPTASRSRSPGRTAAAGAGRPARRLARPPRRNRVVGRAGARRRPRRRGRRAGDRPVLLRGGRGGGRAVSPRLRARSRPRREARPLERRRARAACGRLRRVDRVDLSRRAPPSASSRTAATAGSPGGRESLALSSPETVRARLRAHPRRARPGGDDRRRDQVRRARGHGRARRGRDRGRRREPRAGPGRQARPPRRRLPLALHRPPAEPQGGGRERALRALPLARSASRPRSG